MVQQEQKGKGLIGRRGGKKKDKKQKISPVERGGKGSVRFPAEKKRGGFAKVKGGRNFPFKKVTSQGPSNVEWRGGGKRDRNGPFSEKGRKPKANSRGRIRDFPFFDKGKKGGA